MSKIHPGAWIAIATACLIASYAQAADPMIGERLYQATCSACHGETGISIAPIYPNLQGQKEEYLIKQIRAYRDGTRQDDIMAPMARNLTNTDIAHISHYLARLKAGTDDSPESED